MKIELLIGALFFVGMALAPVAVAEHNDDAVENCDIGAEEPLAEAGGLYVTADGVFQEDNHVDGLQSSEDECTINEGTEDEATFKWTADSQLI